MKTNVTCSLNADLVARLDAWRAPMNCGRSHALELLLESLPEVVKAPVVDETTVSTQEARLVGEAVGLPAGNPIDEAFAEHQRFLAEEGVTEVALDDEVTQSWSGTVELPAADYVVDKPIHTKAHVRGPKKHK